MRHPQPMEFAFFAARAGPHARPLDLEATPVEADFALGPAPAVGRFAARTPIAAAAQRGGIVFHHLGQGRDPCHEAEAPETGADSLPGFGDKDRRIDGRWCAIRLRGVAFLCRHDTPRLHAQGGQRRLPYFNTRRDIPLAERTVPHGHWHTTTFLAYTEQFLVKELRLGDIVVLDTLSSHKVSGVREATEAAGASLL